MACGLALRADPHYLAVNSGNYTIRSAHHNECGTKTFATQKENKRKDTPKYRLWVGAF
jgi:hypothetical protein